ncbi:hypothetical protein ACSNOI_26400 [Actinomadura kijaniata]
MPVLPPGDKLTHDAFGLGTVMTVDEAGGRTAARVDIGGEYGVKRLVP